MRQIEPATPGHQEFAAGGWHRIVNGGPEASSAEHLSRHESGRAGTNNRDVPSFGLKRIVGQSLTPALAAACATYFWVCRNAPSRALPFDMSLISAKCADIASGVQSDSARFMPSLSTILITANEPAPAPMMVRVGASSLSMYSTAGVIAFGFINCNACGGSSSSVMRVAAVGEMMLTRMSAL